MFFTVSHSLPKEFLDSFRLLLALRGRRKRVGAVAVAGPLRQPGQVQVVGSPSLRFSCLSKRPEETISQELWCEAQTGGGQSRDDRLRPRQDWELLALRKQSPSLACMH